MQKTYCKLLGGLAMLLSYAAYADNACCISHQFVPRSITTDLAYTNMLNYYNRHYKEHSKFIYSGNFIYQKSRKSDELGSAFLLKNNCNCVNVLQNSAGNNPPTDINSYWLGLVNVNPNNPFASEFCVQPQRRMFAYYNYLYGDLSDWVCGLWMDVAFSVLSVAHNLRCCEQGNEATACADLGNKTVADALDNPRVYKSGKFDCNSCGDKHRAGVDDIQVRVGYERDWCNDKWLGGIYLIGTIPTGRRSNAATVFEPLIGSRHGSVGVGLNGNYALWSDDCDRSLALLLDANYRYAFKRNECRTFDLCNNGAFSRFLLVVNESDPSTPMPGINFFTQNVEVTPQSTAQLWLALHYEHCNWDVEVGYDFFWRQREKVDCPSCFPENIGIYQLACAGPVCTTASTAVISQGPAQITADATFVTLSAKDLNLRSGAADKALSNKVYGIASWSGDACNCADWHVAFGGSYEFVNGDYKCSTLPFWAVFGQIGFNY